MISSFLRVFELEPADPVKLPLLISPWPVFLILSAYLYFVLKLGIDWMECRKPYNVKKAMLIYNIMQVVINGTIFFVGLCHIFRVYDLTCMESLPLDHPKKNLERGLAYLYFLNKIMDLMDTVFFVLRRSFKQITTLHVYHHCMMICAVGATLFFYGPGGQFVMIGFVNTFVHMIMYCYYFVTARYPHLKGNLWWKKYITKLQILQFIVLGIQAILVVLFNPSCQFPGIMQCWQIGQSLVMITMFGNFYYKAYIKPKQHEKTT